MLSLVAPPNPQVTTAMKVLSICLLVIITSLAGLAQSRRLHLGGCTVGVHTSELRRHYNAMRPDVVSINRTLHIKPKYHLGKSNGFTTPDFDCATHMITDLFS